jgi:hypothetical protein
MWLSLKCKRLGTNFSLFKAMLVAMDWQPEASIPTCFILYRSTLQCNVTVRNKVNGYCVTAKLPFH